MGGHNVNQDVIEYNFTEGIKRVRASLPLFENILFIDGTSDFGDIVAIHIEKSGKHQITDHPAEWFDKYFKEAFDALVDGQEADMYFGRIIGLSLTYRFGGYKAKQHEEVDTSRFGK